MSKLLPLCMLLLAASISVSAQTYTVIRTFGSQPGDPGAILFGAAIAQSRGGLMFSTTPGSQHGIPAAFRIGPLGSIHILHQYGTVSQPVGGLTLARDGRFYGITLWADPTRRERYSGYLRAVASPNFMTSPEDPTVHTLRRPDSERGRRLLRPRGRGVRRPSRFIQRITTDGNMTLLHSFNGSDGSNPRAAGPGQDYRFYGVTIRGPSNAGTIFRVSSTGDFEVL